MDVCGQRPAFCGLRGCMCRLDIDSHDQGFCQVERSDIYIYLYIYICIYIYMCVYIYVYICIYIHREKWCAIFNMFLCATFNTTHLSVPFLYAI